MPIAPARLFRMLVLAALSLHVFCMYSIARAVRGGFGFDWLDAGVAAAFAFIMLIPLVWAVALPEMPEMYTRHVRARKWFHSGRCPVCGYRATASDALRCTECGGELREPEPYRVSARTIRLFIAMNLLAWVIGIGAGEAWAAADERAFACEAAAHVAAGGAGKYSRPRWWPGEATTLVEEEVSDVRDE